jgi:hypothetical protein
MATAAGTTLAAPLAEIRQNWQVFLAGADAQSTAPLQRTGAE